MPPAKEFHKFVDLRQFSRVLCFCPSFFKQLLEREPVPVTEDVVEEDVDMVKRGWKGVQNGGQTAELLLREIVPIHARLPEAVQAEVSDLLLTKDKRFIPKRIDTMDEFALFAHLHNERGVVVPFPSRLPHTREVITVDLLEKGLHRFQ